MRQGSWGLSQRPDLVLKASSCHPDDKSPLDEVAWDASEYALSSTKATTGTALHKLCERMDRGEKLGRIPDPHGDDIKAYTKCMERYGVEHVAIETFRVFDAWKVAGTADRIVKIDGHYYMADIKTGSIDYPAKFAMQMAMYRHAVPYDIETDTRQTDAWQIDNRRALIIHLPAGEGLCELHWIDIEKGWRGCQIAYPVFDWRSHRKEELIWPVADQYELEIPRPANEAHWIARAAAAGTVFDLECVWREARVIGADTRDFLSMCRQRKRHLIEQSGAVS